MKIQTKILLSIITLVVIGGSAIILIGNIVMKDIIKHQIYNQLEATAKSRANHIETYLNTEKKLTLALSQAVVIERLLKSNDKNKDYYDRLNDVLKRLKNTAQINEEIYDIFILDLKGEVIASNIEERIGLNKSDDSYFINGKKGAFIKSPYYSRYFENQPSLAISAPIFQDITNVLIGVAVMRIKLDYLNKITTDTTGLGETGEIYLVNKDGYMITSSRFIKDAFLKQKINTSESSECWELSGEEEETEKKEFSIYDNYIGGTVVGTHYRIEGIDWCLLSEAGKKEAYAPISRLIYIIHFIFTIFIIIGIILSVLISRTITKPILKLHHGTEEIEKGNLNYKVGTKAKDEIGQLSRAFDKMTGELKMSKERMENYSNELEQKVKKRTKDLDEKIKESEQQGIATLNILQDVEETNIKLRQALEKAKESDRLKTTFLNTISHELRTPLNAVIGFSSIIDNDTPIDEILDYSKTINYSGSHLLEIVEDIFDISMIESGEVEIQKEEFNITAFMDDIHKILKAEQELTEKQHIDIYFNPAEKDKDFFVYTDQSNLKRILINILKNALKFTHEGNIEYGYIKETQQEEPMLKFYIKDTGIGISENKLDIIFDIFRQADDTDTRLYGGTGIGLSVSKKLVELLGGKIWVDTEEENLPAGKAGGSTFYFTLPYCKPETFKK